MFSSLFSSIWLYLTDQYPSILNHHFTLGG